MAEIVFAAGVPHAPGLIGLLDAAPAGFIRLVGVFAGALHETATLERLLDGARSDGISAPLP